MPLPEPIVAILVLPLTHVPPNAALPSVLLVATHTFNAPVIVPGDGFIVTVLVAVVEQVPLAAVAVYVIGVGTDTPVGYTYTVLAAPPV
jgi:hypothetical protein